MCSMFISTKLFLSPPNGFFRLWSAEIIVKSHSLGSSCLTSWRRFFGSHFCHAVFCWIFFQPFGTAVFRWLFIIHAYSGQSSDKSYIPPWKLWTFRQLNIERLGFHDPRFLSFKKKTCLCFSGICRDCWRNQSRRGFTFKTTCRRWSPTAIDGAGLLGLRSVDRWSGQTTRRLQVDSY